MTLAMAAVLDNPKTPGVPDDAYAQCSSFSADAMNSPFRPVIDATTSGITCYYSPVTDAACDAVVALGYRLCPCTFLE
eukprot:342872-Chlamydomonas_euryale.AAC.2